MSAKGKPHVVIVGAGPGGLTCAMMLAYRGLQVTVLEAQPQVGGRNAAIRLGPYTFDTGPTFLMLRQILDEVFEESGTTTTGMLDVHALDPMYHLVFRDKTLKVTPDHGRMKQEIERVFPGRGARYDRFLVQEKQRFKRLYPCLQKSYHRFRTLFHPDMLRALPQLSLGRSLFDVVYGLFGDEDLALSFTFQSKYLGMSPWDCPGLFAMIPYIEHGLGIFHVTGGLSRISDAMAAVAARHGAAVRGSAPVKRVTVESGRACGVELESGERILADEVVLNADFGQAMTHLFEPGVLKKYTPGKLARKKLSCSTYMLYLGTDRTWDLPHHSIYFAHDYRANVEGIFAGQMPTDNISFYVRNASATDSTLAPPGHAAVYVLVPVPNTRSGIDWSRQGDFRETVLNALERRAGMTGLRGSIRAEKILTPDDWKSEYGVYDGATFNLAHNVGQMLYFRPRNQFEEVGNCYLVGGGTHPGSGLPTIYESGRIAANLISKKHHLDFVSNNLEI